MFDAFLVTLREISELVFIIAALRSALQSDGHASMDRFIGLGVLVGVLAAPLVGESFFESRHGKPLGLLFTLFLTAGVATMAVSLWGSLGTIRHRVGTRFLWLDKRQAWLAVVGFTAVAVFRELMESVVFLSALTRSISLHDVVVGGALGVVAAALLAVGWQLLGVRAGLLTAFRLSTLLLVLFSIHLALESVGALMELTGSSPNPAWRAALEAILPGGPWHVWVCAALLVYPLVQFTRTWWTESDVDRDLNRSGHGRGGPGH